MGIVSRQMMLNYGGDSLVSDLMKKFFANVFIIFSDSHNCNSQISRRPSQLD